MTEDAPTSVEQWIAAAAARYTAAGSPGLCPARCPWMLATDCELEVGHPGDHAYLLTWREPRR